MIYLLILLDILVYSYTHFNSYFFLIGLINKPYIYYLCAGLVIDFIILDTPLINILFLTILYFINKFFHHFNENNFWVYIINISFDFILYLIYIGIVNYFSISEILIIIGNNLFINMIFYLLSYKKKRVSYN